MRLLHTSTLELHEYYGKTIPAYAILSHTWGDEEVSFQQLQGLKSNKSTRLNASKGGRKIKAACKLAASKGHKYIWIDTCCIDKTSSAELSEAINSMYRWYEQSERCYVYLVDVNSAGLSKSSLMRTFERSRWFTRGWTLQELLAPRYVEFYDKAWVEIDSDWTLDDEISKITGIQHQHLNRPWEASVAAKMSWASGRTTTRVEDIAYSLMGLFGVNMPLLYGEEENAFTRLQHEIVKISDDESIFAWQDESAAESGAFARTPEAFRLSRDVVNVKFPYLDKPPYNVTHRGLAIELHLEKVVDRDGEDRCLAALQCAFAGTSSSPILIELTEMGQSNYTRTSADALKKPTLSHPYRERRELVYIRPASERYHRSVFYRKMRTFYLKKSYLLANGFSISDTYQCRRQQNFGFARKEYGWQVEIDPMCGIAGVLLENGNSNPRSAFAIILVVSHGKNYPQMYVVTPTGSETLKEIMNNERSEIVKNEFSQLSQYSDPVRVSLQDLIITAKIRRRNEGSFIDIEISKQQNTITDSEGRNTR